MSTKQSVIDFFFGHIHVENDGELMPEEVNDFVFPDGTALVTELQDIEEGDEVLEIYDEFSEKLETEVNGVEISDDNIDALSESSTVVLLYRLDISRDDVTEEVGGSMLQIDGEIVAQDTWFNDAEASAISEWIDKAKEQEWKVSPS